MALGLSLTALSAWAVDCAAVENDAESKRVLIPASQAVWVVRGRKRVQLYSAPDLRCPIKGMFIGPGEKLNASMDDNGFVRVWVMGGRNGNDIDGWAPEDRVKPTGTGVGPN